MFRKSILPIAALALIAAFVSADEPTTQPAKVRVRLIYPYSKIADTLTPEQKEQILEIRRDIKTQIIALEQQQRARCMTLMTAEQRAQIDRIEAADTAARKAREAERRAAEGRAGTAQ